MNAEPYIQERKGLFCEDLRTQLNLHKIKSEKKVEIIEDQLN